MRGYKTDQNGRWSPVHNNYDADDSTPLCVIGVMAAILFGVVFVKWWLS